MDNPQRAKELVELQEQTPINPAGIPVSSATNKLISSDIYAPNTPNSASGYTTPSVSLGSEPDHGLSSSANQLDKNQNNVSSSSSSSTVEQASSSLGTRLEPQLVTVVGDKSVRSNIPLKVLQQLYLPEQANTYRTINPVDNTISFPQTPSFPAVRALPSHELKRILVTGGAGFVGSHLVDRLMLMGHEVIVLDNFFTGSKRNVQHWMGHPHFELIRHDVVDPFMIEVDQIYHLACPASPPHYQYNPIKTVKTSVMGTINMLGLAKRTKARFLLTSTSEVYGDPEEHPQKETYWGHVNPIGPRACYDEGKRVAETLTYSYMHQDEVDVRVARIFNTFGPRMNENDGRVVSNFIMQALRGDELTIYGDGQQTRSFQYIHDLVDGLILLMNKNYKEPVNLGNPEEYTIREFAEMIKNETTSDVEIMSLPPTEDDPQRRRPDIGRAQKYLGWTPKFSVGQGIRETVHYFKNHKMEQSRFMS